MQQIRYERLASFLGSHFGDAEIYLPGVDIKDLKVPEDEKEHPAIVVKVDDLTARVNLLDLVCHLIRTNLLFIADSDAVRLKYKR